jgi:DNA-binding transcriptional ArsR family regulator
VERLLPHPRTPDLELVAVLHALADPVRLELVRRLAPRQNVPCAVAAADLGLAASTLSHHYRVLREAGVVHVRLVGRERQMSLRKDDLDTRFPGLMGAVLVAHAT